MPLQLHWSEYLWDSFFCLDSRKTFLDLSTGASFYMVTIELSEKVSHLCSIRFVSAPYLFCYMPFFQHNRGKSLQNTLGQLETEAE